MIHGAYGGAQSGNHRDRRDRSKDRIADGDGQAQVARLEEDDAAGEEQAGADPAPEVETEDGLGGDEREEQVGHGRRRGREEQDPAGDDQVVQDE